MVNEMAEDRDARIAQLQAGVTLDGRTSHHADVLAVLDRREIVYPGTRALIEAAGYRSVAIAPLLERFATETVIASESARLFEDRGKTTAQAS